MNIATLLQMAAEAFPERGAFKCGDDEFTFGELWNAALIAAMRFQSSQCQHIAYLGEASPAVPIALFGAALAEMPFVPLNYRLSDGDLESLVSRISPALMVTDRRLDFQVDGLALVGIKELLAADAAETLEVPLDPEALAVQLFTSGTTGAPKAALLRHSHLFSYIISSVEFMSAGEDEAQLTSVPPYHIAGMSAILSSVYAGRRVVQLPNFNAQAWLRLVLDEAITSAFVVPTMLARILSEIDAGASADCPALRAIAYGGGKMPVPVIERALEVFPSVEFTNAYGLTETSSTVCLLGPEEHRQASASDDPQVRGRLGSVGRPLPSIEIEIRDQAGRPLGPNMSGEVYVRGPQVSGEYREKRLVDDDDDDGWFATRDAGMIDEGGYLYLSGRADDVIVRGGENVSPGEVEDVLLVHPSVSDVAVVGVPSKEWGEAIGAAVVLEDGVAGDEDALRAHVKARLRSSKVPEYIRFVRELPYTETGKLLRRLVKADFQ